MATGDYNRIKRFIKLDELFRNSKGRTYKQLLEALQDEDIFIEKRTLLKDIDDFKELGAAFVKEGRGSATLIHYQNPDFTIFNTIDSSMEALGRVIEKLRIIDDQRFALVRISLEQFRKGIKENETPIMSFQNNPYSIGLDFIEPIADAILNKYPLKLEYVPFNKPPRLLKVHPYHLRQHNNRWVLVGWNEDKGQIHTYPLDRIKSVKHLSKKYIPTDINFDEFFGDVIGTTNEIGKPVEEVVLRIDKKSYKYVMTKPLHDSQTELKDSETDTTVDVRLHVKTNKELEMLILSYGDAMEVIKPLELRNRIKTVVENLKTLYQV